MDWLATALYLIVLVFCVARIMWPPSCELHRDSNGEWVTDNDFFP